MVSSTWFKVAVVIKSKCQDGTVDRFIKHWIVIVGVPRMISDDGGKFNTMLFTDMAEQYIINVNLTAAESPTPNGMV